MINFGTLNVRTAFDLRAAFLANCAPVLDQIMEPYPDNDESCDDMFISEEVWHNCGQVNVFKITGTDHPAYSGKPWRKVLEYGPRIESGLHDTLKNPGYFGSEAFVPPMQFSEKNGKMFITGDGNHRCCIARCLFYLSALYGGSHSTLSGVSISSYDENELAMELYDELYQVAQHPVWQHLRISPHRKLIQTEDALNYRCDSYLLFIRISNQRTCQNYECAYESVPELIDQLRKTNLIDRMKLHFPIARNAFEKFLIGRGGS